MSRQPKGLAGFGEVAASSKQKKSQEEKDMPLSSNNKPEEESVSLNSSVEDILFTVTKKKKPMKKKQISAYIDVDLEEKWLEFGKQYGQGARSELINHFLRSVLK